MDWNVLGIEPTFDKKEITKAYRARLVHTNPEDKPEEFKALRAAYEEALDAAAKAAAQGASTAAEEGEAEGECAGGAPKNPADAWLAEVIELYNRFPKRINPNEWCALLSQDVAVALDTRPQIETMLLVFLMRCNVLPQRVWQLFNDTFKWSDRKNELYENFPRVFIDHVIVDCANYPSPLPLELFEPGENGEECDEYLALYLRARSCEWKETSELFSQMNALSESHPYGRALQYRAMAQAGDGLGVIKLLEMRQQFPEDTHIGEELAEAYAEGEAWEQCENIVRELRATRHDDRHLLWLLAQSLAGQQRFSEGIELLGELMRTAGGDQKELQELSNIRQEWNTTLVEQYEQRLEQGECNDKLLFELSWCYLQNDRNEESVELIARMDTGKLGEGENLIEPYEYYNLSSQAFLATKRFEQAFEDSKTLVEIVRAMQPDGTERTEKRMARLPEMIARCGDALYAQENIDDAMPYYQQAARMAPDNPEQLTHYARVMASLNRWKEAEEAAKHLIEVMPMGYHGHYLLAQCYFEMRNDRDAFYYVNQALELEREDLGVYILRIRILLRNGALQQAVEDLRFLEDSQCGDYLPVLWCKALYAEEVGWMQEEASKRADGAPDEDAAGGADDEDAAGGADDADTAGGADGANGANAAGGGRSPDSRSGFSLPACGTLASGEPFVLAYGREAALELYWRVYEQLEEGEEMDWAGQACFRLALLSQDQPDVTVEKQLEILDKGLELDPRDTDCLDFKAWLLRKVRREDEAKETYLRIVKLPHEGVEAERMLVRLYAKDAQRSADEALAFCHIVLKEAPDDVSTLYYAGLYSYYLGNFAAAEEYLLHERCLEAKHVDNYHLLARVYEAQGLMDKALRECDALLKMAKQLKRSKIDFYLQKVRILCRMGQGRKAVDVLLQAAFSFPYEGSYVDAARVFFRFGMFEENARHLNAWSNVNGKNATNPRDPGGLAYVQMLQELLAHGNIRRAKHFAQVGSPHMTEHQRFDVTRILASYEGEYEVLDGIFSERLLRARENNVDATWVLCDLALVKWCQNNKQAAVQYAQEALDEICKHMAPYSREKPHHLVKQALAWAIVGDYAQARESLFEARALPLCERCPYQCCKDAAFSKACINLLSGDIAMCSDAVRAGRKRWPGDIDFACLEQELKRRGVE